MIADDAAARRRQPPLAWAVLVLLFIGLLAADGRPPHTRAATRR